MQNKRRRTRVPFSAKADIRATGVRLTDQTVRDLSHKGVFLFSEKTLELGQDCMVTIRLEGGGGKEVRLALEGKVARITDEGMAIDFVSMGPDTYMHLRNLILLHAEDPDKLEREFATLVFDASDEG